MRYPRALTQQSTIAVTCPSSGVSPRRHPRLDLAIGNLRSKGFNVVEGLCLREDYNHVSATKEARAAEFMEFYCRDDIDAIYPPCGGELLIEILPLLDMARLKLARPKWVIGYSDISTLLMPLTVMLDIATIHAPNLMDSVPAQADQLSQALFAALALQAGDLLTQEASLTHQQGFKDIEAFPEAPFACTEPTEWKRLSGVGPVRFSGRLIGGCLDTITCLTGSAFGGVPSFANRYKEDGIILFLENCELSPTTVVRFICNLRLAGWMQHHINGIMIGRSAAPDVTDPGQLSYRDALTASLADLKVPILYDVDIGHQPPQMSLIVGSMGLVIFGEGPPRVIQSLI